MTWLVKNGALRLPQAGAGFKVLALTLGLMATPAFAQDEDNRGPLFVCGTGADASEGTLYLSGLQMDDDTFTDLRFEQLAGETVTYSFPPPGTDPKSAFLFSHSDGPEGYLVTVRFADQGRDYELYSLAIPPADPNSDDDLGGFAGGLTVREGGAVASQTACEERPYMFSTYIRDSVGCDASTPFGAAACGEDPAQRTEPLVLEGVN